jgi:uracil-DNA glycosylase
MANDAWRQDQWERRYDTHIAPVNHYVDEIRDHGRGWAPYVAPLHGGVNARVLSILRDPGPATQDADGSGFLCVENKDPSAELQCQLLDQAGLTAADIVPWNAYPWYINREPSTAELEAGLPTILRMLELLPRVDVVLLQGATAQKAWRRVERRHPHLRRRRPLTVIETYHPSRQALRDPDPAERQRRIDHRIAAFQQVAAIIGPTSCSSTVL